MASDSQGGELHTPGGDPTTASAPLTLFQANLLVAMLGGFWGRKTDGHPGPDILGRGLVELATLVRWERLKAQPTRTRRRRKHSNRPQHAPGECAKQDTGDP